jgi:hypothetical protein
MALSRKSLQSWAILGFVLGVAVLAVVTGLSFLGGGEAMVVPPAAHWCLAGIGGMVLAVTLVVTVDRGVYYQRLEYG